MLAATMNPWLPATIGVALVATVLAVPRWAALARSVGRVGIDVNKAGRPEVAEMGGVPVLFGFMLGLSFYVGIRTFAFESWDVHVELLAALCTVLLAALIGLTDDLIGWKRGLPQWTRPFLTLLAAFPLVAVNAGAGSLTLPFGTELELGLAYPLFVVPALIVVATNGFNIVAGFNGLEAGQGVILLTTLGIVSAATPWVTMLSGIMVAALLGFLVFNRYPARIFPGNVLTHAVGAMTACVAILGDAELALAVLFVPYAIEFWLKAAGRFQKESFAKPLEDGSLVNSYDRWYGLTHIAVSLWNRQGRATELRVVLTIWSFQAVFAAAAIALA